MPEPTIRPARAEEASLISDLALRSKGYWGYDAAFLEACQGILTISPAYMAAWPVFVLEEEGRVVGFYALRDYGTPHEVELDFLFIEPDAIGHGHGRRLWRHAAATARTLGYRHMIVESDPHAETFYLAMGMEVCGHRDSIGERRLPLLRCSLDMT